MSATFGGYKVFHNKTRRISNTHTHRYPIATGEGYEKGKWMSMKLNIAKNLMRTEFNVSCCCYENTMQGYILCKVKASIK